MYITCDNCGQEILIDLPIAGKSCKSCNEPYSKEAIAQMWVNNKKPSDAVAEQQAQFSRMYDNLTTKTENAPYVPEKIDWQKLEKERLIKFISGINTTMKVFTIIGLCLGILATVIMLFVLPSGFKWWAIIPLFSTVAVATFSFIRVAYFKAILKLILNHTKQSL